VLLVAPGGDDPLLYYRDATNRTQQAPDAVGELTILSTQTQPYRGSPPYGFRVRSDRTVSGIRVRQFDSGRPTLLSPDAIRRDGYTTLFEAPTNRRSQ